MNISKRIVIIAIIPIIILVSISTNLLSNEEQHKNEALEYQAFINSSVSLIDAIEIAEKETGGKVISIEFEDDNDRFYYEAELFTEAGKEIEIYIDPQSGAILTDIEIIEQEESN